MSSSKLLWFTLLHFGQRLEQEVTTHQLISIPDTETKILQGDNQVLVMAHSMPVPITWYVRMASRIASKETRLKR